MERLAMDLAQTFPDDRGFSVRNLWNMKRFATEYLDFPFLQVPLAEIQNIDILQVAHDKKSTPIWQVSLAKKKRYICGAKKSPTPCNTIGV